VSSLLALVPVTLVAQQPPAFMGFRLGEHRSARHHSFPCTHASEDVDLCEAGQKTLLTFFRDTIIAIRVMEENDPRMTTAQIWRQLLPRMRRVFGQPDSVRNDDARGTMPSEQRVTTIRTTTAYWTRYERRGWRATVFVGSRSEGGVTEMMSDTCLWVVAAAKTGCTD
jgi:hypothetical protein